MERNVDILNELNGISPVVAAIGIENIFTAPRGYFEMVPQTILASVNNETITGEDVPPGYFDDLSNTILAKIEGTAANELQELSPFMAGIKKVNPFEVPADYFEEVPVDITAQVEEVLTPAILQGIHKQPFTSPPGYFEQLAGDILAKVKEESTAKVIAMPKRRNVILKYAAAAVFTGLVTFGVYKYAGNGPATKIIDTAKADPVRINPAMDDKKFEETLNNLGEDDIVQYLEKNGSENDVAALTSGIDENNLPDQEEYFTDETTLDKFLADIELKN